MAARLPPPRPAPGLREPLASGATRRKSPLPAQQTRPSAAPRPHPRRPPRRLLRSLGVSPAEPARRPACSVRRAAGAEPAAGTAPIAPTERGVTPLKTELSRWAGVLGRGPTPHEASWLVGSDVGWSLSRGPVATPSYSWGSEVNERLGTGFLRTRLCHPLQSRKLWFGETKRHIQKVTELGLEGTRHTDTNTEKGQDTNTHARPVG